MLTCGHVMHVLDLKVLFISTTLRGRGALCYKLSLGFLPHALIHMSKLCKCYLTCLEVQSTVSL